MGLIKRLPKEERPREKALLYGVDTLTNSELLAVLLCTGYGNLDAMEIADEIIKDCLTLTNLNNYSLQELCKIKGIKEAKAIRIKAALEIHRRLEKDKLIQRSIIKNYDDVYQYLISQDYDHNKENFYVIYLDGGNKVISLKKLTSGTVDRCLISPREIIAYGLKVFAKGFILAHNHPSGSLIPSKEDIEMTNTIAIMSSMMGIKLVNHIVFSETGYDKIL